MKIAQKMMIKRFREREREGKLQKKTTIHESAKRNVRIGE